jgi:hypothetical protein
MHTGGESKWQKLCRGLRKRLVLRRVAQGKCSILSSITGLLGIIMGFTAFIMQRISCGGRAVCVTSMELT